MKTTCIDSIPNAATKARLEFSCSRVSAEEWLVRYELVMPFGEVDCRGTFDQKPAKKAPADWRKTYLSADNCLHIPLGMSRIGTSSETYPFYRDGELNLPFRDGAHSSWDQEKFNGIAIYYRTPQGIYSVEKSEVAA